MNNEIQKKIEEEGTEIDFTEGDLHCHMCRHNTTKTWNGYVQVPKGSALDGKNYFYYENDALLSELEKKINNIKVHGGLTYVGDIKRTGSWWFGFDTAHLGDKIFIEGYEDRTLLGGNGETYKDKKYVMKQTRELAKQIINILKDTNI
jgi:hypothetical protein